MSAPRASSPSRTPFWCTGESGGGGTVQKALARRLHAHGTSGLRAAPPLTHRHISHPSHIRMSHNHAHPQRHISHPSHIYMLHNHPRTHTQDQAHLQLSLPTPRLFQRGRRLSQRLRRHGVSHGDRRPQACRGLPIHQKSESQGQVRLHTLRPPMIPLLPVSLFLSPSSRRSIHPLKCRAFAQAQRRLCRAAQALLQDGQPHRRTAPRLPPLPPAAFCRPPRTFVTTGAGAHISCVCAYTHRCPRTHAYTEESRLEPAALAADPGKAPVPQGCQVSVRCRKCR